MFLAIAKICIYIYTQGITAYFVSISALSLKVYGNFMPLGVWDYDKLTDMFNAILKIFFSIQTQFEHC